jgi:hypothetical protein
LRRPYRIAGLLCAALAWGGATIVSATAQEATTSSSGQLIDLDWSIGLRGSYTNDSATGSRYEVTVAPEASVRRHYLGGDASIGAGGAVSVDQQKNIRITDAHANGASSFTLDEFTTLKGSIDLSTTQLSPFDSSLPANTAIAPRDTTGTVTGSAERKLGRFDFTGTLVGTRFVEGPTTLADASIIDNTDKSYWLGSATLRTGFEFTPKISVFVEGSDALTRFDTANPSLGVFLNNQTLTLRGGVSYTQPGTFVAEASVGRGFINYADPSLTDRQAWVTKGTLTFTPDETVTLVGSLDTSIGPSADVAGDTDVGYTLAGSAKYQVNPWLTLRGTASFDHVITLGTGDTDDTLTAGAGFDFANTKHSAWSVDYLFSRDQPLGLPAVNTHTVTVGLTIKK